MSRGIDGSQPVMGSLPDAPAKQPVRSYKKKFAKLKIKFELGMRESEELIREELRIGDLSKRIQAQNDQLLEVLLEFNDNLHVTPNLRFDLNAPEDPSSQPRLGKDVPAYNNPAEATATLRHANADMMAGRITAEDYYSLEDVVKRGHAFTPANQYSSLLKVPHTAPQSEEQRQSAEGNLDDALGFLSPEHEAEYYLAMDARLGDESAASQLSRVPEKPSLAEREREAAVRNPVSVYNWLRRNQPHIFAQDNDNASEKSGSRPSQRSKKAQARKEEDAYDEDTAEAPPANSKNKRKRDEDGTYRPKGGSSRSRKKKDDGNSNSRRASKRAPGMGA